MRSTRGREANRRRVSRHRFTARIRPCELLTARTTTLKMVCISCMAPYTLGPIIFLLWGWCVARARLCQARTRRRSPLQPSRPPLPPPDAPAGCPSCTPGSWAPQHPAAASLRRWHRWPSARRGPSLRRRRAQAAPTTPQAPTPTSSRPPEPRARCLHILHVSLSSAGAVVACVAYAHSRLVRRRLKCDQGSAGTTDPTHAPHSRHTQSPSPPRAALTAGPRYGTRPRPPARRRRPAAPPAFYADSAFLAATTRRTASAFFLCAASDAALRAVSSRWIRS
jgi:hypothetical protein